MRGESKALEPQSLFEEAVPRIDRALTTGPTCIVDDGTFVVDELTGALRVTLPLRITPGRQGMEPQLQLTYLSKRGNSPFGLGWKLDVPSVSRSTRPDVPRYGEDDDVYQLNHDDLVPALRVSGGWVDDRFTVGEYIIERYRRRYEGVYDRVERWLHQPSGQVHWRSIDRNNITSIYGSTADTRVSDPKDTKRILRWLLTEQYDDRGNIVRYTYKVEDGGGVDLTQISERHRVNKYNAFGGARYLARVDYANASPHDRKSFQLTVAFDYGEYDDEAPTLEEVRPWSVRPDPYSNYRSGFEVRTWRRCRRVLMFHNVEQEENSTPQFVGATEFSYDASRGYSLLTSARYTGAVLRGETYQRRSTPPLRLGYQVAQYDSTVHELNADALLNSLVDERSRARWVDLHDEGLPGLLSRLGDTWYYARNLGAGRFAEPEAMASASGYDLPDPSIDLPFEERRLTSPAHDREYQPLTTLRTTANVNQDDPYVGYIDLNGDNADDVVVADERVIRWYPSQGDEGFGDPVVLRLDAGEHAPARRLHTDARQSFHVADMNGDGLYDIVRVREDEIRYWPNQGRGRFGDPVLIEGAPRFPTGGAGGNHVLMVDINGSGTQDLVWIGDGELIFWENRSGNRFTGPQRIKAPGLHPEAIGLAAVDLHGDGLACILWVDRTSGASKLRYIAPLGRTHPDLLNRIDNGRGAETRLAYIPSTRAWLKDRAAGGAWLTALPLPVQVVERVETRDRVSGTRQLTRYAYHHGHFDPQSKSFAGFAFIERWDGATGDEYTGPGLFPEEPVPPLENARRPVPLLTKTWRHTGTQFEDADLSVPLKEDFFFDQNLGRPKWLTGHHMPLGQQAKDIPQGHRALHGQLLREEVYALDGPPHQEVPHRVVEQTAWVRQVQPARSTTPPSYDVRLNERIVIDYHRDVQDPRIAHEVVLSLDEFGAPARAAQIHYGRRRPEYGVQGEHHVLVTDTTLLNRSDQSTWYRIGAPFQLKTWELVGLPGPGGSQLFEAREIRAAFDELTETPAGTGMEGPHKRVIRHERTRYWSNDLSKQLSVGGLESRALVARVERLALSTGLLEKIYDNNGTNETLQFEGGYEVDGDLWWAPDVTFSYDASRFYLCTAERDALGREKKWRWDPAMLVVDSLEDGFGHSETTVIHPRTMTPWQWIDANGNVSAARFDPLGEVMSHAFLGKPGTDEGDVIAVGALEASAHDNPTLVRTYDLAVTTGNGPVRAGWVRTRQRERHRDTSTGLRDEYEYYDGFGDVCGRALRTSKDQWLLSDFVERDARGYVVREAQPFFSDSAWPTDAELRAALERGDQITRDPFGRELRRDFPDGTFISRVLGAWSILESDRNDNVLDSRWYAERQNVSTGRAGDFAARQAAGANYETRAAALAAAHARTPTRFLLNAAGDIVATRYELTNQRTLERRIERDAAGEITSLTDSMGRVSRDICRDMTGRIISMRHLDAGTTTTLLAATGDVLRVRDPHGRTTRYRYDAVGRRTHTLFNSGVGPERLIERVIYGGGDVSVADERLNNLVGRPHITLTASGMEVIEAYDGHGQVTRSHFVPLRSPESSVDWSGVSEVSHAAQVEPMLVHGDEPSLSAGRLAVESSFDALGRPIQQKSNAGIAGSYTYAENGRLGSAAVRAAGKRKNVVAIDAMRYDAAGRTLHSRLGNGVVVSRRYDQAGWLVGLDARTNDKQRVQNQHLVRDASGNVMSISRNGHLFESFTYDELGRLIRAEGIEPKMSEGGSFQTAPTDVVEQQVRSVITEPLATERFANAYVLDNEDNLTEVTHKVGGESAVRAFDYHANGNRLRAMSMPEDSPGEFSMTYQHDEAGNIIHSAVPEDFRWDSAGRLTSVAGVGGVQLHYGYGSDGSLRRRTVTRPGGIREDLIIVGDFEWRRRYEGNALAFEQYALIIRNDNVPAAIAQRTTVIDGSQADDVSVRYELVDHIGSVVMELSDDGDIITEETFLPFGRSASRRGRTTLELATKYLGFRGGRTDVEAGLLFLDDRWYSPILGRWVHVDGHQGTDNAYVLYGANPQRD